MTEPQVELINDWADLHRAVELLKENADDQGSYYADSWVGSSEAEWVFAVFVDLVPRLLTQYDSLLEMSYVLADLVEKQHELAPPTGLYLPDHR